MREVRPILESLLQEYFKEHGCLRFCWPFITRWRRKNGETFTHVFRTYTRTYLHPDNFSELWDADHLAIQQQLDEFLHNG